MTPEAAELFALLDVFLNPACDAARLRYADAVERAGRGLEARLIRRSVDRQGSRLLKKLMSPGQLPRRGKYLGIYKGLPLVRVRHDADLDAWWKWLPQNFQVRLDLKGLDAIGLYPVLRHPIATRTVWVTIDTAGRYETEALEELLGRNVRVDSKLIVQEVPCTRFKRRWGSTSPSTRRWTR